MKKLLIFFSAALLGASLVMPTQVFAQQTATASTKIQLSAAPTSASPAPDLQSLRDKYSVQIDTYKTEYHNYTIARDQYFQLQTLVSLEDAVKATKQVLLSRLN